MWKPGGFGYLGIVLIILAVLSTTSYIGYPFSMTTIIFISGVLLYFVDQQIQSRKKYGPII